MKIFFPELTPLQYAVLSSTSEDSESTGEEIRSKLAIIGLQYSGPKFYQLMARIEKNGWLKGKYTDKKAHPTLARERKYKRTSKGSTAVFICFHFYNYFRAR